MSSSSSSSSSLLSIKSKVVDSNNNIIEFSLSNGVIDLILLNYGATLINLSIPGKYHFNSIIYHIYIYIYIFNNNCIK
jgi:hypothetical protein